MRWSKFSAKLARSAERKLKRKAKRREIVKSGRLQISLTALKKRIWAVCSEYIRTRDKRSGNGLCRICGARPIEVAYHILPVSDYPRIRFDTDNIVGACSACNFSEHYYRANYTDKHDKIFGIEFINDLKLRHANKRLPDRLDYDIIMADLKNKLENVCLEAND